MISARKLATDEPFIHLITKLTVVTSLRFSGDVGIMIGYGMVFIKSGIVLFYFLAFVFLLSMVKLPLFPLFCVLVVS